MTFDDGDQAGGVTVVFNPTTWLAEFPELANRVSPQLAQSYFNRATFIHANDGTGVTSDPAKQLNLLNLLTAHIAHLNAPHTDGEPASPLVGRISSATQGSVTVQADNQYPVGTAQWFQQTKYGAEYWAATAINRTFRYARGRTRNFNPWPLG